MKIMTETCSYKSSFKHRSRTLYFLLFLIGGLFFSCQVEPFEAGTSAGTLITQDSELFELLSQISTDSNEPLDRITCIDFIYPFKVFIYNSNQEIIGEKSLTGDDDFSSFLGGLPDHQAISISYPIQTTLADGSLFSVNNNDELKVAIESCSREDILVYYSGLFGGGASPTKCAWTVPYTRNGDNTYAGGVFETNNDGTLRFTYNHERYLGTWTFLYVNDELHLNINLEGTSAVATYWNIDRAVGISNDFLVIFNEPKNRILSQVCETTTTYAIGDVGPAGGIVFYDKGYYSFGWRYMEAASSDLDFFEWGCSNTSVPNSTSGALGDGFQNSINIVNFHDSLVDYYTTPAVCNPLNNGTVAAKEALYHIAASEFKDWFLPSADELNTLYTNLHAQQLGNFSATSYWSATEADSATAVIIDFSTGITNTSSKIPVVNTIKTRVIRYF
ncbi:hypothetical protein [Flavobacterium sp. GCM10023249]|uniref:hypothetical protein n=1 Tax=unclassified Flavobacterium TaxID=196869 RepID=UPI0036172CE2